MKVYALSGPSGTGKSYQAIGLCQQKNIEAVIDDGLFICGNRVEAGISAKRQKTSLGAVKTALFTKDEHAQQVMDKIAELQPESILVLGTSDKMILRICKRLSLPQPFEIINIEDITTEGERAIAAKSRDGHGKHVIPVPTLQLKRDFAGYFMDPLKFFKDLSLSGGEDHGRTVVRPTFSYMGEFFISDGVFIDISRAVAKRYDDIRNVDKVYENTSPDNLVMTVVLEVSINEGLGQTLRDYQKELAQAIEKMTAYNIGQISLEVQVRE